ncbi:MAG: NADH-quinone oxidoreductase subunit NuoF [Armatimonadetes bacterium]|nr:NADH-quinone oxidoreductase subunit NuoF [Armatimonadota bacterium]
MTGVTRIRSSKDLARLRGTAQEARRRYRKRVTICNGTGCRACGGLDVTAAFRSELARKGLTDVVQVMPTGCQGYCQRGPIVVVDPPGVFYQRVTAEDVPTVVASTLEADEVVEKLLYTDPLTGEHVPLEKDIRFYAGQQRIVFALNGEIEPSSIDDYIGMGGYEALAKALEDMSPEQIIQEVTDAGLRGRGGAGFPTGVKWRFVREAATFPKYVICNGDEGDPGAFMDRSLLEATPHSVLEGMLIAGYAMGASEAYIYVRAEYPLAIEHVGKALADASTLGLLGEDILGTGLSFHVHIKEGAGAFVCGEETALITSIEGRRGTPRPRPPFPAQSGLFGKPTNINNVETFANVPPIILNGAAWYAGMGTEKSKGTKIFSLTGKVQNNGLVEVPMGTTLRQVIFEIGGGMHEGRDFKAAQMGGPSGGCVPAKHLDLPIDYESLQSIGAIMGSGGLVVMDDRTCMVDVARFFLAFTMSESCGKCVPCRIGTKQMHDTLDGFTRGEGSVDDLTQLEALAQNVKRGSLCGLGQTAPNPVLSTIMHFREEYEAHIVEKRCPAGVCKALLSFRIDSEKCVGCMACAKVCPVNAITGEKKQPHTIDPTLCIKCGQCFEKCKFDAVLRG